MAKFAVSICIIICTALTCEGLSTFTQKKAAPPIKKVAIIGSGICGLSLAHALENSKACARPYSSIKNDKDDISSNFGVEAHIFESRESMNYNAGAGLQLTGGMFNSNFFENTISGIN